MGGQVLHHHIKTPRAEELLLIDRKTVEIRYPHMYLFIFSAQGAQFPRAEILDLSKFMSDIYLFVYYKIVHYVPDRQRNGQSE